MAMILSFPIIPDLCNCVGDPKVKEKKHFHIFMQLEIETELHGSSLGTA